MSGTNQRCTNPCANFVFAVVLSVLYCEKQCPILYVYFITVIDRCIVYAYV